MVNIKTIANDIQQIMMEFSTSLNEIDEGQFSAKASPEKWSKKEVLGHLIDSAQNNLRRFICAQYEEAPKIIYDQDFWVQSNNYQNMPKENLIQLWRLINTQIYQVLISMPAQNESRVCNTGKHDAQLYSIGWLAEDYVKHMKHHLNQILPGSFAIKYP